ncbi:LptF/LptG family permease [Porphyromonas loveana]|uniref:LptF/LptG family permease n=1 Tax=Porphyromonas loveana TaxID=1884669 RepID=UPI00359F6474
MKKLPVKRLYLFMLQTFLPLLLMTFAICWFVVLMQFLWKYVDDMVGKGLSAMILAKMLFYAAMTLVPMALPLGILLASLMTFGNLGERLELLAMKSAGVPLYRIMKPLFFSVLAVAGGLFIFQNDLMIQSQVKFYTILFSARRAAPELEIPEGTFYNGIKGYNLFVKKKDHKTGVLHDLMIYDHSQGFADARIIVADSGKLKMDEGKTFLTLMLHSGETFQNLRAQQNQPVDDAPIPYMREHFATKEIVIPFDANFSMMDEGAMRGEYVGKNVFQLQRFIDTVTLRVDSVGTRNAENLYRQTYNARYAASRLSPLDTSATAIVYRAQVQQASKAIPITLDSLERRATTAQRLEARSQMINRFDSYIGECIIMRESTAYEQDRRISHMREWHTKFTYPVACLVFFFIGAPLGAIIRKGGLGTPIVASVLFFVLYYMVDTFGVKMAKTGEWPVWAGMWLSTFVLLPFGLFLTYKATRDSSTLNVDTYLNWLKRVFRPQRVRELEPKELVVVEADYGQALTEVVGVRSDARELLAAPIISGRLLLIWQYGRDAVLMSGLKERTDALVEYLHNTTDKLIFAKLMDMPPIPETLSRWLPPDRKAGMALGLFLPISLPLLIYLGARRKLLKDELHTLIRACDELEEIINKKEYKPHTTL